MSEISTWKATWLVAKREIVSMLRSKSFLISTSILLVAVLALTLFAGYQAGKATAEAAEPTVVAVTDETREWTQNNPMISGVPVSGEAEARDLLAEGSVEAAILPSNDFEQDPLGVYLIAENDAPSDLINMMTVSPRVVIVDTDGGQDEFDPLAYVVSIVFGAVFIMSAMTFGSTIAQNTVVEKQTRTVELLVSAVPSSALLGGKILGNSALAIAQTAATLLVGAAGLAVTGQGAILASISPVMIWFAIFFTFGFVLVAAVFAASASLVSRIEDTGSVLTPVMFLVMLPYFVVVFFGQNAFAMTIASFFPFTSTVAMPLRLFEGGVPFWEPLLALLILITADVVVVLVAARMYRRSLLRTGRRLKLTEAWKGDV